MIYARKDLLKKLKYSRGDKMNDFSLKLILKSELKIRMPSYLFRELVEESNIEDKTLGKTELIDSLFEEYSLEEIKEMILSRYDDERYIKHQKRLLDKIEGPDIDERNAMKREEEKKKKRKKVYSPSTGYYDEGINYFGEYMGNLCEYLGHEDW